MLVLKPWEVGKTLKEIVFTQAPIWIQIYGLSLGKQTKNIAIFSTAEAGTMLDVDFKSNMHVWGTSYLRCRDVVDLL